VIAELALTLAWLTIPAFVAAVTSPTARARRAARVTRTGHASVKAGQWL